MESDLYGQFLIWFETYSKVVFEGSEALLEDSHCFCPYGGRITISDSKQIDYALAMTELFGDFANTVEQMKDSIENLSDMAVKSLIGMFDGAMTEYFAKEEARLLEAVNFSKNNTMSAYMTMQTGNDPKEKLAELRRSRSVYEANNWNDIKDINLKDVYAKMQENPNKVELGPRKISGLMALSNPLLAAGYYVETRVRNIRSVLPDMTIRDFFRRGVSKEGITELSAGIDSRNKKMLPGLFGGDVLQSSFTAGYSYYDPVESMKIVDSLSDDGKAAYMLRKEANDGMSAYRDIYGYYQMVKALDMSMKGKVKTGSKVDILDEELEELELYRRGKNIGDFEELEELMTKRNVLKVIDDAGMNFDGIKIKISRDKGMLRRQLLGWTPDNGKLVYLYPNAFKNTETLVTTLGHEKIHILQVRKYGIPLGSEKLVFFEDVAQRSEGLWWARYKARNGVK